MKRYLLMFLAFVLGMGTKVWAGVTTPETDKEYLICYYQDNGTGPRYVYAKSSSTLATTTTKPTDGSQIWTVEANGTGTWKLKNKKYSTYINYNGALDSSGAVTYIDSNYTPSGMVCVVVKSGSNYRCLCAGINNTVGYGTKASVQLAYTNWAGNASWWRNAELVELGQERAVLQTRIALAKTYQVNVGQLGYLTTEANATYQTAIDVAQAVADDETLDSEAYETATTTLNNAIAAVYVTANIVMPEEGKVYCLQNSHIGGTKYYLYINSGASKLDSSNKTAFVAKKLEDGKYVFMSTDGKYLTWNGGADGYLNGGSSRTGYSDTYPATQDGKNDWATVQVGRFASNAYSSEATAETDYLGLFQLIGRRKSSQNSVFIASTAGAWSNAGEQDFYTSSFSSAWKISELSEYNVYNVQFVGVPEGETATATWNSVNVKADAVPYFATTGTISKDDVTATDITGFKYDVDVTGQTITVTYTSTVVNYTVHVSGAENGGIVLTDGGTQVKDNENFNFNGLPVENEDYTFIPVEGLKASATFDGTSMNVVYTTDWDVYWTGLVVTAIDNEKTGTISADENQWYLLKQSRNGSVKGESPAYDTGLGNVLKRSAVGTDVNLYDQADDVKQYLVRLVASENVSGAFNIQFGTGNYFGGASSASGSAAGGNPKSSETPGDYRIYEATQSNSGWTGHYAINYTTSSVEYGWILDNNSAGGTLSFWNSGQVTTGTNNVWALYPVTVEELTLEEYKEDVKIAYSDHVFGTGLGHYNIGENNYDFNGAIDACTSYVEVNNVKALVTINQPETGKFYRVKGGVTGKYAAMATENAQMTMTSDADESTIFYLDDQSRFIGYKLGLGLVNTYWVATVSETKETVTFTESQYNFGKYCLTSNFSGSKVWYDNGNHETPKVDRNSAENSVNCSWDLEEVTELPLTLSNVNEVYYSTIYLPVDATVSDAEVYYVGESRKGVEGHLGTYQVEDAVVAANKGYILCGTSKDITISLNNPTPTATDSYLTGKLAKETTTDENVRVFSVKQNSEKVGFYKLPSGTTTLKAFRAFYETSDASVAAYELDFEGTTGIIANMQNKKTVEGAYDLQGRKVNNTVRGGLYIIDGKKVIK